LPVCYRGEHHLLTKNNLCCAYQGYQEENSFKEDDYILKQQIDAVNFYINDTNRLNFNLIPKLFDKMINIFQIRNKFVDGTVIPGSKINKITFSFCQITRAYPNIQCYINNLGIKLNLYFYNYQFIQYMSLMHIKVTKRKIHLKRMIIFLNNKLNPWI
jgi:hypothetical protein